MLTYFSRLTKIISPSSVAHLTCPRPELCYSSKSTLLAKVLFICDYLLRLYNLTCFELSVNFKNKLDYII
jgi:hypothetical protein